MLKMYIMVLMKKKLELLKNFLSKDNKMSSFFGSHSKQGKPINFLNYIKNNNFIAYAIILRVFLTPFFVHGSHSHNHTHDNHNHGIYSHSHPHTHTHSENIVTSDTSTTKKITKKEINPVYIAGVLLFKNEIIYGSHDTSLSYIHDSSYGSFYKTPLYLKNKILRI